MVIQSICAFSTCPQVGAELSSPQWTLCSIVHVFFLFFFHVFLICHFGWAHLPVPEKTLSQGTWEVEVFETLYVWKCYSPIPTVDWELGWLWNSELGIIFLQNFGGICLIAFWFQYCSWEVWSHSDCFNSVYMTPTPREHVGYSFVTTVFSFSLKGIFLVKSTTYAFNSVWRR